MANTIRPRPTAKMIFLTSIALIAFAANSVLCRMALKEGSIDPGSFTGIRLLSGAFTLLLLIGISRKGKKIEKKGSWASGLMLFIYAICFSYAYVSLDTGTGALIAFSTVQITMIVYSIVKGHKLSLIETIGILLAFGGFVYLVSPGVNAPPLFGMLLMILSGFGWGMYSIYGNNSKNPLEDTAYNFLRSLPLIGLVLLVTIKKLHLSQEGVILALISGTITSGLGYTIWYMALNYLNRVEASVVQLAVPVIAAAGGILFLAERPNLRLVLSTLLIFIGIYLVIRSKGKSKKEDALQEES